MPEVHDPKGCALATSSAARTSHQRDARLIQALSDPLHPMAQANKSALNARGQINVNKMRSDAAARLRARIDEEKKKRSKK